MKKLNLFSWVICCFCALLFYFGNSKMLQSAEDSALDHQFRLRQSVDACEQVVIVGIDQETLKWSDRPVYAWGPIFAELAQICKNASASVMMLDLVLPPGAERAIREHVASVAIEVSLELPRRFLNKLGFEKQFREELIRMKAAGVAFVSGFAWESGQPVHSDPALLYIAKKEFTGYFNLATSDDGVIRRIELFTKSQNDANYSVAVVAARAAGLASSAIPLQPVQYISFRGPRRTFKTVTLKEIIEDARAGKDLTALISGKMVLLGFIDILDFKSTPYGYIPGVEIHANIIDNLLRQRFLQPMSKSCEISLVFGWLALLLMVARYRCIWAIGLATLSLAGWLVATVTLFDPLVLPVVKPSLLLLIFIISESFVAYRTIFLDRRRVRQVFGRYVSDAVVKEILANNDRDFLQGKRRRLCVLMADIRGFTTFSEKHDAHEVVTFLNAYFSRLTDIIMRHRGVVDKFLGDGILAFFNAPVPRDDFLESAVAAAKEILCYTESPEFKSICLGSELKVGIALHCGMAVFGNIGSDKKAEFTVIGDTVNACSRMEGLNKEHKTSILVSSEVVNNVKSDSKWKFIARASLRGKTEEIDLYTISDQED